jgi:hypothetical protein
MEVILFGGSGMVGQGVLRECQSHGASLAAPGISRFRIRSCRADWD